MEENNNDIYQNKYSKLNKVLRILGFIFLPLGIICTLTGMIDFFVAASKFGTPNLFFLCFIGMPLIFVGTICLINGYRKQINQYHASQTAPVTKDVANYMIDGTRESLTKTVTSINNSINSTSSDSTNINICEKCGEKNPIDAKFCSNCGSEIKIKCPQCGHEMDDGAKFCNNCGYKLK